MAPAPPPEDASSLPSFFLDGPVDGGPPRLFADEAEHALRVLRMKPGDHCVGLDGEGRRYRLRIVAAGRRGVGLEALGEPEELPRPGAEGAPLPWIEVAVSWPRKSRAEAMIGRLVQLGAAAITPLNALQSGPTDAPPTPPERWLKLAREACKQCGRAWLPRFHGASTPVALAEAREGPLTAVLDPHRGMAFDTWLRSFSASPAGLGTEDRPIVLAVGPEGGFHEEELAAFFERGATGVSLAPHVLRIETAAEAAMAVAGAVLMTPKSVSGASPAQ